jgi:hypothetical protein
MTQEAALNLSIKMRHAIAVVGASLLVLAIGSGTAVAASYPAGGSTFTGSAEGWTTKSATCTVPVVGLCSASGAYDGTAGNPAGSFGEKANITVNLGGVFSATVSAESPEFTVSDGGAGTLSLQRQFAPGGLLPLTPSAKYTASLVDKTNGNTQQAVSETMTAASEFAGKGGAISLAAGHSYAIRIDSEMSTTAASIGLLGESMLRFDNVSVTGSGSGGNGSNGGSGSNGGNGKSGLSDARLASIVQSSLVGPAVLKGKRIFVKAKCPASIGRACRNSLLGFLKKGKAATSMRSSKIGSGQTRQLVLKVKPKAKLKVSKKGKLLFKESVKAGGAKATVWKRLKLIRRR